jgi:hypothetical protein
MTDNIKLPTLPKASKMYDIPGYDEEELKDYARAAVLADRASRDPSPQGDARPTGATLRCRRCGDTADVSFSYANTEQPDDLLDRVKVEMRHARKFITSRQKMHHVGVEQFDRVYEDVAAMSKEAGDE